MNRRTKEINDAIAAAKKRDGNKCIICKKEPVDGAHVLPRNNPNPKNDPTNPKYIMSLCRFHHRQYDQNPTDRKHLWLEYFGLTQFLDIFPQ